MEPITIILGVTTFISFISTGVNWFKKWIGAGSPPPSALVMHMTTIAPAILPPFITESPTRNEIESFKTKKESLKDVDANDRASSSNPSSIIGITFIIMLVLAVIAFIVYQKRSRRKANNYNFPQNEKEFESPPTEQDQLSRWSTLTDTTEQENLTMV